MDPKNWTGDRDLITSRLLQAGDWRSICWLREQIEDDGLRRWLLKHQGGGLSPRQLRYWQITIELPCGLVDGWVRTARDNPWGWRISEQTYYRWRKEYDGIRTDQVRRLKELEKENTRLKKLVAEISLDNAILRETVRGN